jgi:hypothetical protein
VVVQILPYNYPWLVALLEQVETPLLASPITAGDYYLTSIQAYTLNFMKYYVYIINKLEVV